MTPLDLLNALEHGMGAVLADCGVLSGEKWRVFKQNMPPRKAEDDEPPCPYCLIGMGDGSDEADGSTQDIVIVFGIKDSTSDRQGYQDVLNAIQRVRQHFNEHRYVEDRAEIKLPIKWIPPEDDSNHPFYFGALLLTFDIFGIEPLNSII